MSTKYTIVIHRTDGKHFIINKKVKHLFMLTHIEPPTYIEKFMNKILSIEIRLLGIKYNPRYNHANKYHGWLNNKEVIINHNKDGTHSIYIKEKKAYLTSANTLSEEINHNCKFYILTNPPFK